MLSILIYITFFLIVQGIHLDKRGPENLGGQSELGFLSQIASTNLINNYEKTRGGKYLLPFRTTANGKYSADAYKTEYIGNGFKKGDNAYGNPNLNWGTAGETINGKNFVFITKTVFGGQSNYKQGWEDLASIITSDTTLTSSNPDSQVIIKALPALQMSIKYRNDELAKFAGNGPASVTKAHEDMSMRLQDTMESIYTHLLLKGNLIIFKPTYNTKFPVYKTIPNHLQAELSLLNKLKNVANPSGLLPGGSPQVNNDELVPSSVWQGTNTMFSEDGKDGCWTKVSKALNEYAAKNPRSTPGASMKSDFDASNMKRLDDLKARTDKSSKDYKDKSSTYELMSYTSNEFNAAHLGKDVVEKPVIDYQSLMDPAEYADTLKTDIYYQVKGLLNNIKQGAGDKILPDDVAKPVGSVIDPTSLYSDAKDEPEAFNKMTSSLIDNIKNLDNADITKKQTYRKIMHSYKKYLNALEKSFNTNGMGNQYSVYLNEANKFNTIKENEAAIMKPIIGWGASPPALDDSSYVPFDSIAEDTSKMLVKKATDFPTPGAGTKIMTLRQSLKGRTLKGLRGRIGAGNVLRR
jgi:hypothetical protein